MAGEQDRNVSRSLRMLFGVGAAGDMTDAQLLDRFLRREGEPSDVAFEALVIRHGALVLGVCRHILNHPQDVEDAFQATFLVLARRARSIRRRDSLPSWLFGVARRVSSRAKSDSSRRRAHERKAAERAGRADVPDQPDEPADVALLYEEVGRLPEKYREPIILCYLERMTYEAAARRLGCPLGTVSVRLRRAKERLRSRLSRRGMAMSTGLADAWPTRLSPATLPRPLVDSTVRATTTLNAGGTATAVVASSTVAGLAEGVLKAMFLNRMLRLSAGLLAIFVAASGSFVLAQQRQPKARQASPPGDLLHSVPRDPTRAEPAPVFGRLRYGDRQADGKRSLGGSGEMIEFEVPEGGGKLTGVRIHGSRYGMPEPPDESFLIYVLNEDLSEIVAARMAPYSLFERGDERWVEATFARPVEAPKRFWVALDFRAQQTKGVYVSYDASTGGTHSRIGLPGIKPRKVNFGGDWMIEAALEK